MMYVEGLIFLVPSTSSQGQEKPMHIPPCARQTSQGTPLANREPWQKEGSKQNTLWHQCVWSLPGQILKDTKLKPSAILKGFRNNGF